MFKFQRFISGPQHWSDHLYAESEHIGIIGRDKYGLFINIKRNLSLKEYNLLIAQLLLSNPDIMNERLEIQVDKEGTQ